MNTTPQKIQQCSNATAPKKPSSQALLNSTNDQLQLFLMITYRRGTKFRKNTFSRTQRHRVYGKMETTWLHFTTSPTFNAYDSMSDLGEIRVYQRADFQSGSRVLKKVFWTFSYLYLWHTMWFHAKKLLRTLKFWKSLNSLCKSGSRPQKSPKKAQKTDHSIAIYSNFWIGMVYFGYHLVKAHVQTVQNMYGKGG